MQQGSDKRGSTARSEYQAVTQVTEMVSGRQVVKSRQSLKVHENELAYCGVLNLMGERWQNVTESKVKW